MKRGDFRKEIQMLLEKRPTKNLVKIGRFGPFTIRKPYTMQLPESVIRDYDSFILENFSPFEEDIPKPSKKNVLYSLSSPKKEDEPVRCLFQTASSESGDACIEEESVLFEISHADHIDDMSLEDEIRKTVITESFSDMLIRFQNERKVSAPDLYKSAGIDFRHFSKIISDRNYKPKKETAFALAIALRMTLSEAEEFIGRAGYSFSPSSLFDMTIKYFIHKGIYDRNTIDLLMDSMKLPLLPQNWDMRHL